MFEVEFYIGNWCNYALIKSFFPTLLVLQCEEDPNDGQPLLDELEQDDILSELLRNACKSIELFYTLKCISHSG